MHQDKRLKQIIDLGLPPLQLAVLIALSRFANWKDHSCKVRLVTIARTAVTSQRSVSRAIKQLDRAGHIEIRSGKRERTASEFIVLPRMLDLAKMAQSDSAKLANRTNYNSNTTRKLKDDDPRRGKRCEKCKKRKAAQPYGPLCWECAGVPDNVVQMRKVSPDEYPI